MAMTQTSSSPPDRRADSPGVRVGYLPGRILVDDPGAQAEFLNRGKPLRLGDNMSGFHRAACPDRATHPAKQPNDQEADPTRRMEAAAPAIPKLVPAPARTHRGAPILSGCKPNVQDQQGLHVAITAVAAFGVHPESIPWMLVSRRSNKYDDAAPPRPHLALFRHFDAVSPGRWCYVVHLERAGHGRLRATALRG